MSKQKSKWNDAVSHSPSVPLNLLNTDSRFSSQSWTDYYENTFQIQKANKQIKYLLFYTIVEIKPKYFSE